MKCSELMKTNVVCCRGKDTVAEAATMMRDHNIGFVPVCDEAGVAIGTITDRDLAIRVLAEYRNGDATLVEEVMSSGLVTCNGEDELSVAEALMSQHKKSRIVCTDARRMPVGVISLSDIARVEQHGRAAAVLRSVAQREVHA